MVNYAKGDQILDPVTYQSTPKSYLAGQHQVSEATPTLIRSNHRKKSWRKAEKQTKNKQKTTKKHMSKECMANKKKLCWLGVLKYLSGDLVVQ